MSMHELNREVLFRGRRAGLVCRLAFSSYGDLSSIPLGVKKENKTGLSCPKSQMKQRALYSYTSMQAWGHKEHI